MPRIRTIKPDFWSSPSIAQLPFQWRLLFIAMWNWADDYGRGSCEPRELLGFAFPNDEEITVAEFRRGLDVIRRVLGVKFYALDGRHFYYIPSWEKHQKIDRRSKGSKFPAPQAGTLVSPLNWQVIAKTENPAEDSGENIEDSEGHAVDSGTGTGEQGNRGTGEGGGLGSSDLLGGAAPVDNPPPQNLDELAAAHAAHALCDRHRGMRPDEVPPCRACEAKRLQEESSKSQMAAKRSKARRQAIDGCDLCDENGMRFDKAENVARRCDHNAPKSRPRKPAPPF